MRIVFACDHAAFDQREPLLAALREAGHEVLDLGTQSADSVDYPDVIAPAAEAVSAGRADRAVVMCATGIGASIVANRFPGVRCAHVTCVADADLSRRHNDANAVALGGRSQSVETNLAILRRWLEAPFDGGRHQRRVDKIAALPVCVDGHTPKPKP